jgi:ribulose 1,5-bisphosphate synthetase/thiazole synthase
MERLQLVSEAIGEDQDIYDFIVVGGGISGLQAADILTSKPQTKILIIEAQSELGGRIGSISIGGVG